MKQHLTSIWKIPVIGEWKKKPIHTLPKIHFQIQSTYIDSQTFNLSNSFCARQSLVTTYIHEVPNLFFLYVGGNLLNYLGCKRENKLFGFLIG